MPKTRKQKEEDVIVLQKTVAEAGSVVFVGFDKFKVLDERQLRKNLRETSVSYTVIKKSLLKRAIEGVGDFPGQVALAFGFDPILPARGIAEFSKKHEGLLTILGGVFEGKLVNAQKMQMIAAIPDRQILLGMLANVLQFPMRGLAIALDAIAKQKMSE